MACIIVASILTLIRIQPLSACASLCSSVSRLPAFACFPVCQHRFRKTIIPTHQLKKLSGFPLTGLSLGISAFAFIKPPLGYPDFFQTALVRDSMLLTVLNYLCNCFSCKHLFLCEDTSRGINSLHARHRLLTADAGVFEKNGRCMTDLLRAQYSFEAGVRNTRILEILSRKNPTRKELSQLWNTIFA